MSGRAGLWTSLIEGAGQKALSGNSKALGYLRKLAGTTTASGGFSNLANDYLHEAGVSDVPYVDENRKQAGALGQALKGAAPLWGGALLGGGLLNAAGAGAGAAASGAAAPSAGALTGKVGLESIAKTAAPHGIGGLLSQAGNYALHHPGQVARFGLGTLGAIQGSHQQGKADQLINRSLAPLNQPNPYADLNIGSYGNPYSQPAQMSGRQSLRRELMR